MNTSPPNGRLVVLLILLASASPGWIRNSRGHAQVPTFSVNLAGASHRAHLQLTNQHVLEATLGLALSGGAGLRWGPATVPDIQVTFLTLAGFPYHAYTAGVGLRQRNRGIHGRLGAGLIQRPVQWDPINGGDSFYTTRNRFGLSGEVGYQFPLRTRSTWGPIISWTSSFPEGDLKWRFELITVGVALRYR